MRHKIKRFKPAGSAGINRKTTAVLQRSYSINTYDSYAVAVKQLIKLYHRPPDQISLCELQPFFDYLVRERKLAPASCQGYLAGIQFFLRKSNGLACVRGTHDCSEKATAHSRTANTS